MTKKPLIVAGPCSAESREQILETAQALKDTACDIFRAGVWKARTRPGTFEGAGEEALCWLQEAQAVTSLPAAVEVALPKHVELALKYDIKTFWIGARTTSNPFAMQQLADCLRNTDYHIFVKNPCSPDLDLWLGAIERLQLAGVENISAVHRGFHCYGHNVCRNTPLWQIALDFHHEFPDIPLICDPSHIAGKAKLVPLISLIALQQRYDGLMIEVHPNPEKAKSDAQQQITPEQLKQLLANLQHFESDSAATSTADFSEARSKIDEIDQQLLTLIDQRMQVSRQIALQKKETKESLFQPDRYLRHLESLLNYAEQMQLSSHFIAQLFAQIHDESLLCQIDELLA